MPNKLTGLNLVLTLNNGVLLGGQKSFDYTFGENIEDVTSTASGEWIETQPMGGKQFKGTADTFYTNPADSSMSADAIFAAWNTNASLGCKFAVDPSTTKNWSGAVWISQPKSANGGVEKPLMLSFSMVGVGKFNYA